MVDLYDLREMQMTESGYRSELLKFRVSCKAKYLSLFSAETTLGLTKQNNQITVTVFDLNEVTNKNNDQKLHLNEFTLKDQFDHKHDIVDILEHPLTEELVLFHDSGGYIHLLDILTGTIIWQVRERNFYTDISDGRSALIEQCQISPDGQKIISMTKNGQISLYSHENSIPGSSLAPID